MEQKKKEEEGGSDKEKDKDKEKQKESEVEIEYITEEPEIYDPNYIFFKRIFEAFKVTTEPRFFYFSFAVMTSEDYLCCFQVYYGICFCFAIMQPFPSLS